MVNLHDIRGWWGPGVDRRPLEIDLVAEDTTGKRLLVGEVKWGAPRTGAPILHELRRRIDRLPFVDGRDVIPMLWLPAVPNYLSPSQVVTAPQVLDSLR